MKNFGKRGDLLLLTITLKTGMLKFYQQEFNTTLCAALVISC